MKSFVYKTIVIVIAVVVIFEFTLGSKINEISSKFNYFSTKEGRKEGVIKIREEMKKAVSQSVVLDSSGFRARPFPSRA